VGGRRLRRGAVGHAFRRLAVGPHRPGRYNRGMYAALAVLAAAAVPAASRPIPATTAAAATRPAAEVLLPGDEPDAAAGAALVLYLPSAAEPQVERFKRDYWPLLRERRCAVLVPPGRSTKAWTGDDAQPIMDAVADVQKRCRTDPKRLILMGTSGGAQMALFLADKLPDRFRAVIVVSTNPVVVRGRRYEWFYPPAATARTCPYFVVNHITHGDGLKYWRQVRAKRQADGASISIVPVLGPAEHYQPPPKELGPWLDEVLAGRQPAPLADPQAAAVAKMFAGAVAAMPKALTEAKAAADPNTFTKDGKEFRLTLAAPRGYLRSAREERFDAAGLPITELRVEHATWPIYVRLDARRSFKPFGDIVAAEEKQTVERGLLYQVYHAGAVKAGGRDWKLKCGSITYPDAKRGWVSALFLHAVRPIGDSMTQWLELLVLDETGRPDAAELAELFHTVAAAAKAQAIASPDTVPTR